MRHAPHFLQWASAMELNPAACITTMQYSTKVAQERYRTPPASTDLEQVTFGNQLGGTSTTNTTKRDIVKWSAKQCDFSACIDCECRSVVDVCRCLFAMHKRPTNIVRHYALMDSTGQHWTVLDSDPSHGLRRVGEWVRNHNSS